MKQQDSTRFVCNSISVVAICLLVSAVVTSAGPPASAQEPSSGGEVVFLSVAGTDYVDPGLTWYTFGWMLSNAVNRPLYSISPDQPDHPTPDLAESDPVISADNRSVTVTIKPGIRFSPPVNREVTSRDVKYAMERAFTRHVPSGYVFTYFGDLVGAPSEPGPLTDIPGIQTPDDLTIVFNLETATAPAFAASLVLPITVPVPKEYARPFDRENPSMYDTHVVFTGPYMIRNNAEGELVGLGDDIELIRNPNWDPVTDYRPAHLDEITIRTGGQDIDRMARRTLTGSHRLCCDSGGLESIKEFLSTYPDQIGSMPGHGTRWVALNTTIRPLKNLNVRRALFAAMDRKALRRARGGHLAGRIATHFIASGVPGFEESGGYVGFSDLNFTQHPGGDPALAKGYMLAARRDGVPITRRGKYAGDKSLLMVGTDSPPGDAVARRVKRQIEELGFKVEMKLVAPDEMFIEWCGVRRARVAICPNVGWFIDFMDPQSLLEPTFSGDRIGSGENNANWSFLDRPKINDAIKEAALVSGPERFGAWAEVNHMITALAPGIPYLWDVNYQLESPDVEGVMNPYSATWDLTFTSLKT